MDAPVNPYAPPHEQSAIERPRHSDHDRRVRKLLLEAAQAFFTIVGIMAGWGFIGFGGMRWFSLFTLLGIAIIGLTCSLALGIRLHASGPHVDRK